MKTIKLIILSLLLLGCNNNKKSETTLTTYDVEFDVDYNNCGIDPLVSKGVQNWDANDLF